LFYSKDEHITPWHHVIEYPNSLLDKEFGLAVINDVLYYCLYKCSLEVDYCMEEVIEHTLKNYYGSFDKYPINKLIYQLDLKHAGKHGFYVNESNYEIDELLSIFKTFKALNDKAVELYQMDTILRYFGLCDDSDMVLSSGKVLYNSIGRGQPMYNQNIKALIRLKESGLFNAS
jgi:hypothetical protein